MLYKYIDYAAQSFKNWWERTSKIPIMAVTILIIAGVGALSSILQFPSSIGWYVGLLRRSKSTDANTDLAAGRERLQDTRAAQRGLFIYSVAESVDLHDFLNRLGVRLQDAGFRIVTDKQSASSVIEIRDFGADRPEESPGEDWRCRITASVEIRIRDHRDETKSFTTIGGASSPAGAMLAARNQLVGMVAEYVRSN